MLRISGRMRRASGGFAAAGAAVVLLFWYFEIRLPPIPQRPLRIGFEPNPPVQIRSDSGFSGVAVETVNEAAKRAGVHLQWVETGTSSDEAFQKGLVDLWPLMADLPDRRKHVHFTRRWLHSSHALLLRAGSASPDPEFTGRIALFKMPLHVRLLRRKFSGAQLVELTDVKEVVSEVCRGAVDAGFLEGRVALTALRERPPECASAALRVQILRDLTLQHGVASTFEAAGAAEAIRREIGNMFRDGTLALTIAKYSYYGLDDTWATYDLMEASERARWTAWGIGALVMVLTVTLWRAGSLRQRRRAEAALRESEQQFRATFFQAAVGIAHTSLDAKWLLLNDRFCEILGYTQAELSGKTFLDITHPDDREASLTGVRHLLAGDISSWLTEKRYIRKDGTIVWARLWVSLVLDPDKRPQYFISVMEDITERVLADRALRDSEQRLMLAQNAAHIGVWERDLRTNVKTISGEYAKLYGLPPDHPALTYEEWLGLIHPDDRERLQTHILESIERTGSWDTEFRVVWPDGSVHWVLTKGTVVVDDSGQPVRRVGVNLDITERKQSEEVRSHLAAIVESSDDAIIGKNLDGVVVSWNPGAERIYGYKAEEMLGRPLSLLVPPDRSDEIPELLERLRHGEGFRRFETTRVGKDGRRIEVSVTISPIHDGTGAVVGAAVIAHNITEQVKARDLLRKSEERLKTAERLAHVGNWEWDMKTDRLVWSEEVCRIFGRPEDYTTDYAGFLQAVQPHDRERVVRYVRDRMAGKSPNILEFQITRPDGGVRTISGIAEAVRDERGLPVRMLGAWQDITDQKLAEAALRRSLDEVVHLNRVAAMGELTASLAHELNQPLAAILLNSQAANRFLRSQPPDLARVRDCLNAIAADDERAGEIIKRLRGLLKKGEFQPSSVDLNEVVSDAILLARNDALRRRVSVKFEPLPGLPPVLGDRIQLYQVALNLIMNGLDAVVERPPEDRWVLARAVEADGYRVELTVEDSGKGIAENDLSRVFEPFFSTKQEGLGMGLSICRSIVEAHGGRIWAERRAGPGAIFRCLLPVAQRATVASAK